MSTLASNSIPIDTDKNTGTKVFATPSKEVKPTKKNKTQRKKKLTLKRRKVR
jgi:hypothetical protein